MPNSIRLGSEKLMLVFLGKAGTGKGTQAQMLARKTGILHVSMGDVLREEIAKKTALGKQVEEIVKSGRLVPDELTAQMIEVWIDKHDLSKGVVFDGFPRTLEQAQMFDKLLAKRNLHVDLVLNFTVPGKKLIERLSNRRTCEKCGKVYNLITKPPKKAGICDLDGGKLLQRDDDREESIKERFKIYDEQIKPMLEFYKGKVVEVEASGSIEQVGRKVMQILEKKK